MRLLLDTHVAIWSVSDAARLPSAAIELMRQNAGDTYVSVVTLWEIAIKHSQPRRDPMPFGAAAALGYFVEAGHQLVDLRRQHALAVESLADLHTDPFDRLLVAQAISEEMQLVTLDRLLAGYHPAVILF